MTEAKLMSLGLFVFTLSTAPFDKTSRETGYEFGKKFAITKAHTYQALGQGEDKRRISGKLVDGITGGEEQMDILRDMEAQGKSWNLVSGKGDDLGAWYIDSISQNDSHHAGDGTPRVIEFEISLFRDFDETNLGQLENSR